MASPCSTRSAVPTSIYDTTASPFGKLAWGRCTKKEVADGTMLYLHVFDWPEDGELPVPGLKNRVQQAYLLADGTALQTREQDPGLVVSLPAKAPDPINSVVVLKVSGALDIGAVLPKAGKYTLRIKPDRDAWQPINLRKLVLKPRQSGTGE